MSDENLSDIGVSVADEAPAKRKRTIADLPDAKDEPKKRPGFAVGAFLGGLAAMLVSLAYSQTSSASAKPQADEGVRKALEERLPRTKVDQVNCANVPGLCEVAAGNLLFYTDIKGRYLIVGRVYDMETRSDITASRLLELRPELLLAGAAGSDSAGGARKSGGAGSKQEATSRVDLSALPSKGAIRWGPQNGDKVILFSDFRCSYCQKLAGELRKLNVRVEERPISVLGSRKLSEAVYCAKDQLKAHDAAYAGSEVAFPQRPDCSPADLDENEAFASRNGFNGTPVLVRADGTVLVGYRPAAELSAWVKASTSGSARG